MLSDPTNALLGKPLVCTVIIEDRPVSLKVSAEKGAICAGGISSTAHFTLITATLTDYDKKPIKGEKVSFTNTAGSLDLGPPSTAGRTHQTFAGFAAPITTAARKSGLSAAALRLRAMLIFAGCFLSRHSASLRMKPKFLAALGS